VRRRLRRSGLPYWAASLTLAGITGLLVTGLVDAAQAQAARFGQVRSVYVTTAPVDAGQVLADGDVERRSLPTALLPEAAVATDPVGRAALVPLLAGEVVVDERLAPTGLRGAAALVPAGARALAVPAGGAPVGVGDRVDLIATFDTVDDPSFTVAEGAIVVAVDADAESVTVAVAADDAPRVAYVLAAGRS
jgi:Flp pilus assembly protein CpaB